MKTQLKEMPFTQKIEGNWKQFVGQVKEKWGELTDDDIDRYRGRLDQLEGYIQQRTGEKRESVRESIEKIANKIKEHV